MIQLLDQLALQELNGFGGKSGDHLVSKHNIEHVGDLRKYSVTELMEMVRDLHHSEKKSLKHFEHRYRAEDPSVQKRTLQNGSIMLLVESVMKW